MSVHEWRASLWTIGIGVLLGIVAGCSDQSSPPPDAPTTTANAPAPALPAPPAPPAPSAPSAQSAPSAPSAPARDADERQPGTSVAASTKPLMERGSALGSKGVSSAGVSAAMAGEGGIRFSRHGADVGVDFIRYDDLSDRRRILESTGGGVAMIDIDHDGHLDLFLTNGCQVPGDPSQQPYQSRLYRNLGDLQFREVTDPAGIEMRGYGQGCAVGDIDADGFDDLYVTAYGVNRMWRNNGDGTFTEVTSDEERQLREWSTSCAFADLNNDGLLDLYVANYLIDNPDDPLLCPNPKAPGGYEQCPPSKYAAVDDRLWINDGQGGWIDASAAAGLQGLAGKALGVVIWDFDRSGLPEIFVANDGQANFLLTPVPRAPAEVTAARGDGTTGNGQDVPGITYVDRGLVSGVALSRSGYAQACMGVAPGDYDGDGEVDLIVTNFYGDSNTVYRHLGQLQFEDVTRQTGLAGPSRNVLGWGAILEDFDRDGLLDLFVANGHVEDRRWMGRGEPYAMSAQVFAGRGSEGFRDVSADAGEYFQELRQGRGVAAGDLNRDGRIDLVISCQDSAADVLINQSPAKCAGIEIELVGRRSNRQGIGAWIEICDAGGQRLAGYPLFGGGSYQSSSSLRKVVPLLEAAAALKVKWPSGVVDEVQIGGFKGGIILEERGIIPP